MLKKNIFLILFNFLFLNISVFAQSEINKDSLLTAINSNTEDSVNVINLNKLAKYYFYKNTDSSLLFSKRALNLSEKISYKRGIALSYKNIGITNYIAGNYEKSLNYLYKSLTIYEKLNDLLSIGQVYKNIGIVHFYQKDFRKSLSFNKKTLKIFKTKNNYKETAGIYNNIGLIYTEFNQPDSAQFFFEKTIEIAKKTKDRKLEIRALGNSARILLIKGEYKKSIEKNLKILEITDTINDKASLSVTYSNIALAYFISAQNETNKSKKNRLINNAEKYYKKALKTANEVNSNIFRSYAIGGLKEVYQEKKEYKTALKYFEKYCNIKDSMFNNEKSSTIADIELKYKNEKKQLLIKSLQKEKQANKTIIYKQNIIILSVTVGIIITVVLLIFMLYLFREKNKALKLLDKKNKTIIKHRIKLSEVVFELKKSNKAKNKLFSIIAHDLKSPFQAIIGLSELLSENYTNYDDNKRKKFIKLIHESSLNAFNLLTNLFFWANSQIKKTKLAPQRINLKEMVSLVTNDNIATASKKDIQIINTVKEDEIIFADKEMVSIVLRNLISNSIKFTPHKGKITISSKQSKNKEFTEVSVSDTGVGISKKHQKNIFKHYKNKSTYGTDNEQGTGLGLSICKEFIRKNKGEIWVESKPGEGSTFTFTIPKNNQL